MQTIKRWIYGGLTNGGEIRKPELWVFNAIEVPGITQPYERLEPLASATGALTPVE